MDVGQAKEIFDGLMLGDGALDQRGNSALFKIQLADNRIHKSRSQISIGEFVDFLNYLKDVFRALEVGVGLSYPYVGQHFDKRLGKTLTFCHLSTKTSEFLLKQYHRWYEGGRTIQTAGHGSYIVGKVKKVPGDLILTNTSLAYWYMGDGGSTYNKEFRWPDTSIASDSFSESEADFLAEQLLAMGIHTWQSRDRRVQKGSGIELHIANSDIDNFMRLIDPYVIPPYRYKVNYSAELASERAGVSREYWRLQKRRWRDRKKANQSALFFEDLRTKIRKSDDV